MGRPAFTRGKRRVTEKEKNGRQGRKKPVSRVFYPELSALT
jgi:hypothetical protein